MEDDILNRIVEVESNIEEMIRTESKKAEEQLEKVKIDTKNQVVAEEARLKESLEKSLKDAKLSAEEKIFVALNKARSKADKIEKISNEVLKNILLKHITKILPEK